jgi:hypothetical protein
MSRDLEQVRQFFQERKHELITRYKAQGGGIGKNEAGDYVIVLYLDSKEKVPPKPVEKIDGIAIQFEVTGRIRLQ